MLTGKDLEGYNLHWMPTLMSDTQMVLPTDTVMYQAQEVAAVIATSRYVAADGVAAVEVDYDPITPVIDPFKALEPDAPVLRVDKEDQTDNLIWHWEAGDEKPPPRSSPRPTWWCARRCTSRAFTWRPSKPAAAWPTSTPSRVI